MLIYKDPFELYANKNGIDERDKTGLSGFSLKVNNPPADNMNFISGEYDGAM